MDRPLLCAARVHSRTLVDASGGARRHGRRILGLGGGYVHLHGRVAAAVKDLARVQLELLDFFVKKLVLVYYL